MARVPPGTQHRRALRTCQCPPHSQGRSGEFAKSRRATVGFAANREDHDVQHPRHRAQYSRAHAGRCGACHRRRPPRRRASRAGDPELQPLPQGRPRRAPERRDRASPLRRPRLCRRDRRSARPRQFRRHQPRRLRPRRGDRRPRPRRVDRGPAVVRRQCGHVGRLLSRHHRARHGGHQPAASEGHRADPRDRRSASRRGLPRRHRQRLLDARGLGAADDRLQPDAAAAHRSRRALGADLGRASGRQPALAGSILDPSRLRCVLAIARRRDREHHMPQLQHLRLARSLHRLHAARFHRHPGAEEAADGRLETRIPR